MLIGEPRNAVITVVVGVRRGCSGGSEVGLFVGSLLAVLRFRRVVGLGLVSGLPQAFSATALGGPMKRLPFHNLRSRFTIFRRNFSPLGGFAGRFSGIRIVVVVIISISVAVATVVVVVVVGLDPSVETLVNLALNMSMDLVDLTCSQVHLG